MCPAAITGTSTGPAKTAVRRVTIEQSESAQAAQARQGMQDVFQQSDGIGVVPAIIFDVIHGDDPWC